MKLNREKLGVVLNFIYSVIGLVVMNGVMSLVVQPFFGRELGAAFQGRILYYNALAGLMASTFGCGANYGRMKVHSTGEKTVNGEYNIFLLISAGILFFVTLGAVFLKKWDYAGSGLIGLFLFLW